MKCPRCAMAELNGGHCPICHLEVKRKFTVNLQQRIKARIGTIPSKLWEKNWNAYQQMKPMLLMLSVLMLVVMISALMIVGTYFIVPIFVWLMLMAGYDVHTLRKEKGAQK